MSVSLLKEFHRSCDHFLRELRMKLHVALVATDVYVYTGTSGTKLQLSHSVSCVFGCYRPPTKCSLEVHVIVFTVGGIPYDEALELPF